MTWMLVVVGNFGSFKERIKPVTLAMNEKRGMDDREFMSYFMNLIIPLYLDAKDVDGKHVMVKIESGPGQLNIDLLAQLRILGFVLYLGLSNTTAISQETN